MCQVIKDKTDVKKEEENKIIEYYEAVKIAYTQSEYMQKISRYNNKRYQRNKQSI
jgi:hypothetical protein